MKSIGNAIKGFFFGFILVIGGIGLLWFNESNNVKNIKAVEEGRKEAADVVSSPVDSKNEGKLVNVNGEVNVVSEITKDATFNIGIKTAKLLRKVEMFQWEENDDNEDSEGNTIYTYNKVWSEKIIDSFFFEDSVKYANPEIKPFDTESILADEVKIGDFKISDSQKEMFNTKKQLSNLEGVTLPTGYTLNGSYITDTVVGAPEMIGDIRISYSYNDSEKASMLGMQQGDTLVSYKTKSNKNISMLEEGIHSASEMLDIMETQNNTLKWILRAVGYVLIILGFSLILGPIDMLARFVPFFGGIIGGITFLIAILLGSTIATLTIALAWIVFRPLLGGGLIVVSLVLGFLFVKYVKGKKDVIPANIETVSPVQNVAPAMTGISSAPADKTAVVPIMVINGPTIVKSKMVPNDETVTRPTFDQNTQTVTPPTIVPSNQTVTSPTVVPSNQAVTPPTVVPTDNSNQNNIL